MDRAAHAQPDLLRGELGQDVSGVGQRPCQPVELGDDEGVTATASGQGEVESGPVTVRASQAVVDVDAVITDTECAEFVTLCSEILMLSRYACVSTRHVFILPAWTPRAHGVKTPEPWTYF